MQREMILSFITCLVSWLVGAIAEGQRACTRRSCERAEQKEYRRSLRLLKISAGFEGGSYLLSRA
jgi:hypothetical protein